MTDMVKTGEKHGARWFTAGRKSKAGHPHHPLYLKADSVFEEFNVMSYIESLK